MTSFTNLIQLQAKPFYPEVFVLVDESHTQYGELHIKMKQIFPNACYLGFTAPHL